MTLVSKFNDLFYLNLSSVCQDLSTQRPADIFILLLTYIWLLEELWPRYVLSRKCYSWKVNLSQLWNEDAVSKYCPDIFASYSDDLEDLDLVQALVFLNTKVLCVSVFQLFCQIKGGCLRLMWASLLDECKCPGWTRRSFLCCHFEFKRFEYCC